MPKWLGGQNFAVASEVIGWVGEALDEIKEAA